MATFLETCSDQDSALGTVNRLRAAGVPVRKIRMLIGRRPRDLRNEPVGGFAGAVPPDAPVDTFANTRLLRRTGAGTFAGDANRQRQGSFADADRHILVSYGAGARRADMARRSELRRLLRVLGCDEGRTGRTLGELDAGNVVVLAEAPPATVRVENDQIRIAA